MSVKLSNINKYSPIFVPPIYWKDSQKSSRHPLFSAISTVVQATQKTLEEIQETNAQDISFLKDFGEICHREIYKYIDTCNGSGPCIESDFQFSNGCKGYIDLYHMLYEPNEHPQVNNIITEISKSIAKLCIVSKEISDSTTKTDQFTQQQTDVIKENFNFLSQFIHLPILEKLCPAMSLYLDNASNSEVVNVNPVLQFKRIVDSLMLVNNLLTKSPPFFVCYIKLLLQTFYTAKGVRLASWWCKQRILMNKQKQMECKITYLSSFDYVDIFGNHRRLHFDNPIIEMYLHSYNTICGLIAKLGNGYTNAYNFIAHPNVLIYANKDNNSNVNKVSEILATRDMCGNILEHILSMRQKIQSLKKCTLVGRPEGINMKWVSDLGDLNDIWTIFITLKPESTFVDTENEYNDSSNDDSESDSEETNRFAHSQKKTTSHTETKPQKDKLKSDPVVYCTNYTYLEQQNGYSCLQNSIIIHKMDIASYSNSVFPNTYQKDIENLTPYEREIMLYSVAHTNFGCELSWLQSDKHDCSKCEKCSIDITRYTHKDSAKMYTTKFADVKNRAKIETMFLDAIPPFLTTEHYDMLYNIILATKLELDGIVTLFKSVEAQNSLNKLVRKDLPVVCTNDANISATVSNMEKHFCSLQLEIEETKSLSSSYFKTASMFHKKVQQEYIENSTNNKKIDTDSIFQLFALTKNMSLHSQCKFKTQFTNMFSCFVPLDIFDDILKNMYIDGKTVSRQPIFLQKTLDEQSENVSIVKTLYEKYNLAVNNRLKYLEVADKILKDSMHLSRKIETTMSYVGKLGKNISNFGNTHLQNFFTTSSSSNQINSENTHTNTEGSHDADNESATTEELNSTNKYDEPSRLSDTYTQNNTYESFSVDDTSENDIKIVNIENQSDIEDVGIDILNQQTTNESDNKSNDEVFSLEIYKTKKIITSQGDMEDNLEESEWLVMAEDPFYFTRVFFQNILFMIKSITEDTQIIFREPETLFINTVEFRKNVVNANISLSISSDLKSEDKDFIKGYVSKISKLDNEKQMMILKREKTNTDKHLKTVNTLGISIPKLLCFYITSCNNIISKNVRIKTGNICNTHIFLCGLYEGNQKKDDEDNQN